MDQDNTNKINIGKLIIGLNIMLVGAYILLGNLGVIDFGYLPFFWKLWPVIFIIIGLNIIFRNEGITYLGSLVVTAMLILIMIASVPGASGAGTRKVMGINDEPIEFTLKNLGKMINFNQWGFSWHGEVKQTIKGSQNLDMFSFPLDSIDFILEDRYSEKVDIKFIPSTENQKIDYAIGLKTDDIPENKLELDINISSTDSKITIRSPKDLEDYYDLTITIYKNPETAISTSSAINSFEIDGDWMGDTDVTGIGSGDFISGKLAGKNNISTSSGNIFCEFVKDSNLTSTSGTIKVSECDNMDIRSTSGDIIIGECSNINLKSVSGNIRTNIATGRINISTTSGDIIFSGIHDLVSSKIKAVSGNITINDFFSETGNISISSVSGDVDITFSSAVSNSVRGRVTATSGGISLKSIDMKNRNFIVGDGKTDMVIKTVSGDVNLRKLEQE
jgi:Toastrack DUF4097/LiaF transmembrane domain